MGKPGVFAVSCCALLLAACASNGLVADTSALAQQVADTERAFAKTMADRDLAAFAGFVDDEAIFYGSKDVLHGRAEIVARWKEFYSEPTAPFSWEPEKVEVLPSGKLAQSSGPVRDPNGRIVAAFNSIWRLQSPGVWKIVFDKGNNVCDCTKP